MSYYGNPYFVGQPFQYQDQLSQLRTAQPPLPGQSFQPQLPQYRQDPAGLLWVQGEAGAKAWIVTPGTTVLLMDSEEQKFYLKSADQNGVPTMKTYTYTEVMHEKPQAPAQQISYVTAEEFNGFRNDVMQRISALSAPVAAAEMKGENDG
jgi:hypothetical protein